MGDTDAPSSDQDGPERSSLNHTGAEASGVHIDAADPGQMLGGGVVDWLVEHAASALRLLGAEGELRLQLVDDARMQAAHLEWMDDPTTTDVLTFDMREMPEGPLDTDLIVCVDEARRQALAHGHELKEELLLYIVHGALHCLGHDDATPEEAHRMHAEEDRLLAAIGIGAVFGTAQSINTSTANSSSSQEACS
jgi:probable rRNA maturation factor